MTQCRQPESYQSEFIALAKRCIASYLNIQALYIQLT